MADYLYGQISDRAVDVDYEGIETNTTRTIVDNDERTIRVDVTSLSPSILDVSLPSSPTQESYVLNADVEDGKVNYSWRSIGDLSGLDEAEQYTDQKVQEEKERAEKEEAELKSTISSTQTELQESIQQNADAINEVKTNVGELKNLTTDFKENLVGAVNEVKNQANTFEGKVEGFQSDVDKVHDDINAFTDTFNSNIDTINESLSSLNDNVNNLNAKAIQEIVIGKVTEGTQADVKATNEHNVSTLDFVLPVTEGFFRAINSTVNSTYSEDVVSLFSDNFSKEDFESLLPRDTVIFPDKDRLVWFIGKVLSKDESTCTLTNLEVFSAGTFFKGEWQRGVVANYPEIYSYKNSSYICRKNGVTSEPMEGSDDWVVLVKSITPDITIGATVENGTGVPEVEVTKSEDGSNLIFQLTFKNLSSLTHEQAVKLANFADSLSDEQLAALTSLTDEQLNDIANVVDSLSRDQITLLASLTQEQVNRLSYLTTTLSESQLSSLATIADDAAISSIEGQEDKIAKLLQLADEFSINGDEIQFVHQLAAPAFNAK